MLRELRIYDCHAGKMPNLIRRFEDHTRGIFDRLGIRYSDFWISSEDPNQLIYFLFWDDMVEHEKKWPVFLADPEWIKVRDARRSMARSSPRSPPATTHPSPSPTP